MAIGKSKKTFKKKGRKKVVDTLSKKQWFHVRCPNLFKRGTIGRTCVNPTAGGKNSADSLKGRVYEVSLGDLNGEETKSYMMFKLKCEEVQGSNCLTNLFGMRLTRDKLCSLIRKWRTLVETHVNVKTTDGYTIRIFCIGFSQRNKKQIGKTTYIQTSVVKRLRKKIVEILINESRCSLPELMTKVISETIPEKIRKTSCRIYPLTNVAIHKIKVLKAPKVDLGKLMDLYRKKKEEVGETIPRETEETTQDSENKVEVLDEKTDTNQNNQETTQTNENDNDNQEKKDD
ncbi:40S ribosomal protein S3A [Anaeramoeba ignava]|uniref:Small ribosomal subunit protein eS1 n=1 Tax=Anaeramoeba ignava TaxID=1746090 RepID=A0A9Q0LV17_ANAIG|nr:40S ribosomal protein S3A [Anaeramoeba ignava]|eukprot:Anaeramoba_ignava/a353939_374.p1 GENE.a353939_374~~a353939_374.p1  ORF type:complete len:288 (+),score=97.96 a353939_374:139-1002(+)